MTNPPEALTTEALSPAQTSAVLAELEGSSLTEIAAVFEGQGPPATVSPAENVSTTAAAAAVAPTHPAPAPEVESMEALEAQLSKLPPFQQASQRFTLMVAAIFTGLFEGAAAMLPGHTQTPAALATVRDQTLDLVALSVLHALSSTLQSEGFSLDRLSGLLLEAATTPAEVLEERYLPFFEALKKLENSPPPAPPPAAPAATAPPKAPGE